MRPYEIFPRRNSPRKLSRTDAFEAQGVTLRYPSRSWSGVRCGGGGVVIAIREGDVQEHEDGFSCLLWAAVVEGATQWVDRPSKQERLEHCRLAVVHGGADGLMVCGEAAQVDPDDVLGLRVEKRNGEYWASWGFAARRHTPGQMLAAQALRLDERHIAARIAA